MTQTMSGPNDWLQFYNQNLTPNFAAAAPAAATTIADTCPSQDAPNSSASGPAHLSPEGRVAKPTRRRSRASRRTPTTLLNTDTTNFRAMVQQFTGGPTSVPSAAAQQVLPNLMGFGFPSRPSPSPTTLPITYLQQQQHNMFQHQNQHYSLYNTQDGGNDHNNNNLFFQRLSNNVNPITPPPTSNNNVVVNNNNNNRDGGTINTDHGRFFPNTSSS